MGEEKEIPGETRGRNRGRVIAKAKIHTAKRKKNKERPSKGRDEKRGVRKRDTRRL